jgi:hypothetical protein
MDSTRYLNSVAWRTYSKNVILLSLETLSNPATYRITISPIDINEPGAAGFDVEIGYFYKDYIGHTYSIIAKSSTTIDISDDFRCGQGPQSGLQGIVYRSVWRGRSPYLAPVYYRHLDKVAIDYSRQIEQDILWSNDPNTRRIDFLNISQPSISDYQDDKTDGDGVWYNLQHDYGDNPKLEVWQETASGVYSRLPVDLQITRAGGLIQSVLFSGTGEDISGYILISK